MAQPSTNPTESTAWWRQLQQLLHTVDVGRRRLWWVIHSSHCQRRRKHFHMYGKAAKTFRVEGSGTGQSGNRIPSVLQEATSRSWTSEARQDEKNKMIIPSRADRSDRDGRKRTHTLSGQSASNRMETHTCPCAYTHTQCAVGGEAEGPQDTDRAYRSTRCTPPVGHVCRVLMCTSVHINSHTEKKPHKDETAKASWNNVSTAFLNNNNNKVFRSHFQGILLQNKSNIFSISTNYNGDWQVFSLIDVKILNCNPGQISSGEAPPWGRWRYKTIQSAFPCCLLSGMVVMFCFVLLSYFWDI